MPWKMQWTNLTSKKNGGHFQYRGIAFLTTKRPMPRYFCPNIPITKFYAVYRLLFNNYTAPKAGRQEQVE